MILSNVIKTHGFKPKHYLNMLHSNKFGFPHHLSQRISYMKEIWHPYYSSTIVSRVPKKKEETPFNSIRNQLEEICNKFRSKVLFLNDNEVWIVKKLPHDEIFSLPDISFSQHAVLCFEQEELAQDMRSIIVNFNPATIYVIEPVPFSYIIDICEKTKKGLIIFRRDIDNKLVCRRYL